MWVWIVLAMVGLWAIVTYNALVQLRLRADNAWSDISVQLKRRYDLVPNLVETVKGYASHEAKTFQEVTAARARAMEAAGPEAKGSAEQALAGGIRQLFAVAESYPELRANRNFLSLQQSLTAIEDAVQGARRYYNAVVRDYNTKLAVIPDRLVGQLAKFSPKEFFQLDSAAEGQAPRVALS